MSNFWDDQETLDLREQKACPVKLASRGLAVPRENLETLGIPDCQVSRVRKGNLEVTLLSMMDSGVILQDHLELKDRRVISDYLGRQD